MDEASASRAAYERVNRILRRFDRAYSSAATQVGLSDSALDVLWALYDAGEGCLQRDICAFSCLGKQTVNSSVHKLVKEGMLRLEPAQAGRGMRVFLTPACARRTSRRSRRFPQKTRRRRSESPRRTSRSLSAGSPNWPPHRPITRRPGARGRTWQSRYPTTSRTAACCALRLPPR